MGRPKKVKEVKVENGNLSIETIKKLWSVIEVDTWLDLLKQASPANKWQKNSKTIKGVCPYHSDTDPSLHLNFAKGFGKCFGCGKVVNDLVELFSTLLKRSYTETIIWLTSRARDIEKIIGDGANAVSELHQYQEVKKAAAVAFTQVFEEYIREKPATLSYMEPAFIYLTQARKLDVSVVTKLPIAIFPKPEHAKRYIKAEYKEAYDEYFKKYNDGKLYGSIVFHYNDNSGSISRFKIRKIATNAEEIVKQIKALDVPSEDLLKSLALKEFVVVDDKFYSKIGVFGLYFYRHFVGMDESTFYITEGEFDALAVMAQQLLLERNDFIMLAAGGMNNQCISMLNDAGVSTIYLVQDVDEANGIKIAGDFLKALNTLKNANSDITLKLKIFKWPPDLMCKDLDELVNKHGYEKTLDLLYNNRRSNFMEALGWAKYNCDKECDDRHLEYEKLIADAVGDVNFEEISNNYRADENKFNKDSIARWMEYVQDPIDKRDYVQYMAGKQNIDLAAIDEYKTNVYSLSSMEGVTAHLKEKLLEYIQVAYKENKSSNRLDYTIWVKRSKESIPFDDNKNKMDTLVTQCTGMGILTFIKKCLGNYNVLDGNTKTDCMDILSLDQMRIDRAKGMMRNVFMAAIQECPNAARLTPLGQGIHYCTLTKDSRDKKYLFFVNGIDVFKGEFTDSPEEPILWEPIESLTYEGLRFNMQEGEQWSGVTSVDDLNDAVNVKIGDVYAKISLILQAWKFREDELLRQYLAAYIMMIPVMYAVGRTSITYITGSANSGKTSFLKGLLGGTMNNAHDVIPILEASKFSSNSTIASIYQSMHDRTLLMCLDEMESSPDNKKQAEQVQAIEETLLSIPMGGANINRGGVVETEGKRYQIRCPILMASIHMNSNPTFLSRVFTIYTESELGRESCTSKIASCFESDEEIYALQKEITIGLLPYVKQLSEEQKDFEHMLHKIDVGIKVSDRFVNCIAAPLQVIKLLFGEDRAIELYKQLIVYSKDTLENIATVNYKHRLLTTVLYTNAIKRSTDTNNITDTYNACTIIHDKDYNTLNNSGCGIYVIPEKGWIIIQWAPVINNILRNTPFARTEIATIKNMIAKNKFVITNVTDKMHRFIRKTLELRDLDSPASYTVLKIEYIDDTVNEEAAKAAEIRLESNARAQNPVEEMFGDKFGDKLGDKLIIQ